MADTYEVNVVRAASSLDELIKTMPDNQIIFENMIKAWSYINSPKYEGKKIMCAISGGSDSDIVMDICVRCDKDKKIRYVWFNTGLEMSATIRHLDYLEGKYGVKIHRIRPQKPIPVAVKEFGVPFVNKRASEYLYRLQKHGFKFEDEDISVLRERYCKKASGEELEQIEQEYRITGEEKIGNWCLRNGNWYNGCVSALEWWCNCSKDGGENSQCNINRNKWLKEFLIANPPTFKIANLCCKFAKKDVAHDYIKEENIALNIVGVRKAEGGLRATSLHGCFSEGEDGCDNYRPVFWYKNSDKREYEKHYDIVNSDCYLRYGMMRTGCSGCLFSQDLNKELEILKTYEPLLYKAVMNVFGVAYDYTKKYRDFANMMNIKTKGKTEEIEQLTLFEYDTFYDDFVA